MIDSGVYPDMSLLMAFRKSLKGSAADVLLHLGTGITPASCVQKLDTIFGNVLPIGTLLERFWSARQNQGESVRTWACRLQGLVSQVSDVDPSIFPPGNQSMLRTKFWSGLRDDKMRIELRHLIDSNVSFDQILRSARVIENEATKDATSHQAEITPQCGSALGAAEKKKLDDVLSLLQKMDARLTAVEKRRNSSEQQSEKKESVGRKKFLGTCYRCKQRLIVR